MEAAGARDSGAVVLLPVGSVEPHGPHLPLATDILIAEETARRAAIRLAAAGLSALTLPAFPYATVEFSAGFAGAVGLTALGAEQALAELLTALHGQGWREVALVNAHLEPAHIACLRAVVERVGGRTGHAPLFPDITRRALAARLTDEFRSGACHAGQYETSLVMAVRPDLVKEEVRLALPAVPVSLVDAIRSGRRTFREAGLDRAYCGDPAAASAEEGHATYDVLAQIVAEQILEALAARSKNQER